MKLFNKTSLKFFGGFAAIVAGSIAIAFIAVYFSPESREERMMERLQGQHANDTYGGDTPEETLELFIKALEDGDVELASKYFVVEKQEETEENIRKGLKNGGINNLITSYNIGSVNETYYEDLETYEYDIFPKGKDIGFNIEIVLNNNTGKWKISKL